LGDRLRETWRAHGLAIGTAVTVAVAVIVGVVVFADGDARPPVRKIPEITMVTIEREPPPPVQEVEPPPEPEVVEEEMIEQPEIQEEEIRPEEPPPDDAPPPDPAQADQAPGPLGLDMDGEGPGDAFNLAGRPGGNGLLGGGGGGGSRWGWYAYDVQRQVEEALRRNRRTRTADTRVEVRLWVDAGGRVTRAQLKSSTGDPEVDAAIRDDVLASLRFEQPPPSDMPMPIVARLTARRPS
jgi:TonB family protein